MTISWSATSPTSGKFASVERSDFAGLIERFDELRAQGRGYLEVRGSAVFPVLTLGFAGSAAVVHLMTDEDAMSLLAADEPGDADAEVVVLEDQVDFTADFVLNLERAWQVVQEFVRTGDRRRAGEWREL
ncbi:Imm1 family immunity protein [Micromonospora sp. DT43]